VAAATIRIPNTAFRALAGDPINSEIAVIFRKREASLAVKNFIRQIVQSPAIQIRLTVPT
jgi:hypothetical protein